MKAQDVIHCSGHPNVRALHPTTFEVTTEPSLSPAGDCIIGVCADRGASDLNPDLKTLLASYPGAAPVSSSTTPPIWSGGGAPSYAAERSPSDRTPWRGPSTAA